MRSRSTATRRTPGNCAGSRNPEGAAPAERINNHRCQFHNLTLPGTWVLMARLTAPAFPGRGGLGGVKAGVKRRRRRALTLSSHRRHALKGAVLVTWRFSAQPGAPAHELAFGRMVCLAIIRSPEISAGCGVYTDGPGCAANPQPWATLPRCSGHLLPWHTPSARFSDHVLKSLSKMPPCVSSSQS